MGLVPIIRSLSWSHFRQRNWLAGSPNTKPFFDCTYLSNGMKCSLNPFIVCNFKPTQWWVGQIAWKVYFQKFFFLNVCHFITEAWLSKQTFFQFDIFLSIFPTVRTAKIAHKSLIDHWECTFLNASIDSYLSRVLVYDRTEPTEPAKRRTKSVRCGRLRGSVAEPFLFISGSIYI